MKSSNKTLVLSKKDILSIVNHFGIDRVMDDLIKRLEDEISNYDPAQIHIPIRDGFNYTVPNTGLVEWMPIYKYGNDVVIKIVGYHPNNPSKYNLPTIISTISTYDTATGHLKSLVDGVFLTAIRTGASSAVASKVLAHHGSKTLGLIGCGAQAVTQLHALSRLFNFETVLIYDIDQATMASFEGRIQSLDLNCSIEKTDIETIVKNSDIICTATSKDVNSGPLFDDIQSLPHVHVNAVGSDFPGKIELPVSFLKSSKVVPDFLAQAVIEGESQQLKEDEIYDDWVKIIKDSTNYSHLASERTVFDSTGWALEDLVASSLFTEYATKIGKGTYMEIESLSTDVKNPYGSITSSLSLPILEKVLAKTT
jgi:ornithine cyclodeaminase/alanine dehydrogenase-like protein (mu-crystallin family)